MAIALDFVCVHCKRNLIEIRLNHRVQLTNTDDERREREKIHVSIKIILFLYVFRLKTATLQICCYILQYNVIPSKC